jgi:hypothetical protein
MPGEATLTLKVIPDWSLFDAGLREREAKGINIGVGTRGGRGGGGGSTSTDPSNRQAEGYERVERDFSNAVRNRNSRSGYAQPNSGAAAAAVGPGAYVLATQNRNWQAPYAQSNAGSPLGPYTGGSYGLQRYAGEFVRVRRVRRQLPNQTWDFEGEVVERQRALPPPGSAWRGFAGNPPGGRPPNVGYGYAPIPNPPPYGDAESMMQGVSQPLRPLPGRSWNPTLFRTGSLYRFIGRYAPFALPFYAGGSMLSALQSGQMASIAASGNGIATAQASIEQQKAAWAIPDAFSGGLLGNLAYGAQERSVAAQGQVQSAVGERFGASQERKLGGLAASGQISYAAAIGDYAKDVVKANADFNQQQEQIRQSTKMAYEAEDTRFRTIRDAISQDPLLSDSSRASMLSAEGLTHAAQSQEIDALRTRQNLANYVTRSAALRDVGFGITRSGIGYSTTGAVAGRTGALDPLGAQIAAIRGAAAASSVGVEPIIAAQIASSSQQQIAGVWAEARANAAASIAGSKGAIAGSAFGAANMPVSALRAGLKGQIAAMWAATPQDAAGRLNFALGGGAMATSMQGAAMEGAEAEQEAAIRRQNVASAQSFAGSAQAGILFAGGNVTGSIAARAAAERSALATTMPQDTPEAIAAFNAQVSSNKIQEAIDIQTQKTKEQLQLQQFGGRVQVTGLQAAGKPYSAEAADIFNRVQEQLIQLSLPGTANAGKLKEAAIAAGRNEEMSFARQLTLRAFSTPGQAADILNPYSIGNRGRLPVSLTESAQSGIGAALGFAGRLGGATRRGPLGFFNNNDTRGFLGNIGASLTPLFPVLGSGIAGSQLAPPGWINGLTIAINKLISAINHLGGAGAAAGTSSN